MQQRGRCALLLLGSLHLAVVALGCHEAEIGVSKNVIIRPTDAVLCSTNQQVTVVSPSLPPHRKIRAHLAQGQAFIQ